MSISTKDVTDELQARAEEKWKLCQEHRKYLRQCKTTNEAIGTLIMLKSSHDDAVAYEDLIKLAQRVSIEP
jgi:hypothetical protein